MKIDAGNPAGGLVRKYGAVKWFGGHNHKTGRENNFGFIEAASGKDVLLHKKEWKGSELPGEGDLVTYFEEEGKDGKLSARRAVLLDRPEVNVVELYDSLCSPAFNSDSLGYFGLNRRLYDAIKEILCKNLGNAEPEQLRLLVQASQGDGAQSIFLIVANGPNAAHNYGLLVEVAGLRITDDAPWAALPSSVVSRFEEEIATHVAALDPLEAREKCQAYLDMLPASLLTFLLTRQVYTTTNQLGRTSARVYEYLKSVFIKGTDAFPAYLQASFDADMQKNDGKPSNQILSDIVENLQFKRSLFDKNIDFVNIYTGSTRLNRNIETFVLYQLLSLIIAGNDREVVYNVFMQRLWEAIGSKSLSLDQQKSKLQNLFPSCTTMGRELSCEAVHWPKQNLFLCRGKTCYNHKVLPNPHLHYLDFSIYDWLSHYGINYMTSGKPQTKDFPIKLAGYFNRLREIFPALHCGACGELMVPNMQYARTEYKELSNGVVEVKEMAAAYRLTVFNCNNNVCDEFKVGYYINHCVGFGCYHIIDSRVLKQRCSEGRYICTGCGSCCSSHAKSNPAGMCGECGSPLKVYNELPRGLRDNYTKKYAKCASPLCGSTIGPDNLPAKFSLLLAENDAEAKDANDSYDLR